MPAGPTLGMLIGPIAAATVLNAFLFALMWRGHQTQMRTGTAPWWLGFGLAVYAAIIGLLAYARRGEPIAGSFDLFGGAMVGEAAGVVITYGLVYSFVLSRGRPWSERATPMVASVFLTGLAVVAILTA